MERADIRGFFYFNAYLPHTFILLLLFLSYYLRIFSFDRPLHIFYSYKERASVKSLTNAKE